MRLDRTAFSYDAKALTASLPIPADSSMSCQAPGRGPAWSERLLLDQLPLIERVVASICRRNCCYGEDAEDFSSEVKMRLIQNDYEVLAKFRGKSSLATYLSTVVHNLFRDFRIAKWGKWRPSAAAQRLGEVAVQLEILTTRDQLSLDEAIEMLVINFGVAESREELMDIAGKLPQRLRPSFYLSEELDTFPSADGADSRLEESQLITSLARTGRALRNALGRLEPEDRKLLQMRFADGLKVTEIARILRLERRPLYSRFEKCLRKLRQAMEEQGISSELIREIVGRDGGQHAREITIA